MMFVKCHHWMHLHWFNNKTYTQRDSCNHWIIILNLSVQPINYEMHLQHIDFWTECCIYKPLCDLTTPSLYNLYITSTNFCLIIKWYFDIFDEYGLLLLLFETVVITPLISDHLHSSPGLAENCSHLNCCSIAIIITTHISQLWISCGTWGVIWAFKLNIVFSDIKFYLNLNNARIHLQFTLAFHQKKIKFSWWRIF